MTTTHPPMNLFPLTVQYCNNWINISINIFVLFVFEYFIFTENVELGEVWPVIWIPGKDSLQIWIWKFLKPILANWKFTETERFCPNHNLTFLLELDLLLRRRLSDLTLLGNTCTPNWPDMSLNSFSFLLKLNPSLKDLCCRFSSNIYETTKSQLQLSDCERWKQEALQREHRDLWKWLFASSDHLTQMKSQFIQLFENSCLRGGNILTSDLWQDN